MPRQQPPAADAELADRTSLRPATKRIAQPRVFREVSPEEAARIVERFRRLLAGPPLRVGSAILREAEGDSV